MNNRPDWYPSEENQFSVKPPERLRGNSRNSPCICGSGAKAKNCNACRRVTIQPITDKGYVRIVELYIRQREHVIDIHFNVGKLLNWYRASIPVEDACVLMVEYIEDKQFKDAQQKELEHLRYEARKYMHENCLDSIEFRSLSRYPSRARRMPLIAVAALMAGAFC